MDARIYLHQTLDKWKKLDNSKLFSLSKSYKDAYLLGLHHTIIAN